jgi:hypothetical protein
MPDKHTSVAHCSFAATLVWFFRSEARAGGPFFTLVSSKHTTLLIQRHCKLTPVRGLQPPFVCFLRPILCELSARVFAESSRNRWLKGTRYCGKN